MSIISRIIVVVCVFWLHAATVSASSWTWDLSGVDTLEFELVGGGPNLVGSFTWDDIVGGYTSWDLTYQSPGGQQQIFNMTNENSWQDPVHTDSAYGLDVTGGGPSLVLRFKTMVRPSTDMPDFDSLIDIVLGGSSYVSSGLTSFDPVIAGHITLTDFTPSPVPEPATMLLFGTGLIGFVGSRLRKKKK